MIVPMKKISLIILESEKEKALKKLRHLGLLHIEITESSGSELTKLKEHITSLESGMFIVGEGSKKKVTQYKIDTDKALEIAQEIGRLTEEEKSVCLEISSLEAELERLKSWDEVNPYELNALAQKGIDISLYEMPLSEYEKLDNSVKTLPFQKTKNTVKFLLVKSGNEDLNYLDIYRVNLPVNSTGEIREKLQNLNERIKAINEKIISCNKYSDSFKDAIASLKKEIEFETYAQGMIKENLSSDNQKEFNVSYFTGYIPAEDLQKLKSVAKENAWGLISEEPCVDDDVPTKLKNNKFVSLVYPLTDFLGTVPGYFEFDISSWFLGFILIFFGIIFGDGGYGLLICAISAILIGKSVISKKSVPPTFLLIGLLGLSTVIWGTLTCTWFGMSPDQLPPWLKSLSVPVISNVYADKLWYPFWTGGSAGLTTPQNIQILCFSLALVQLTVAHIKCAIRNSKSLKILGDIGAMLELIGIFYIVLMLVVNGEVFSFGLHLIGIPVGTVSIALIGIGFVMNFVFANYEGSIVKSILESLTNIVSVLLGVVNVFSDIVSYIRLWAVGLAGAAISATVNELAGPLLSNFMFIIFAIIILVFGHGLNMILNILSVIVHGIRLNTLEFSSHLDMSWSGHKYKPFEE